MDDPHESLWLELALYAKPGPSALKTLHTLMASEAEPTALSSQACQGAGLSVELLRRVEAALADKSPARIKRQRDACRQWASRHQGHLLTFASPLYPALLYEIAEPPPLLFVRGLPGLLSRPQLAIVGSRSPSADGRHHARRFACDLVAAGYGITSGLAAGIDTESHAGALAAGGWTIAVAGTGLDSVYPPGNAGLAEQICESGALVSEFQPDTPPKPGNFPRRNRIISGLAVGVLVVEAARRSGSLITARLAGEQGREVFAIPGSIHNPMVRGCHQLIRQGAKLVETAEDILEEVPTLLPASLTMGSQPEQEADISNLALPDPAAQALLQHIGWNPVSVDVLAARSGVELPLLHAALVELELGGHVEARDGTYVLSSTGAGAKMQPSNEAST